MPEKLSKIREITASIFCKQLRIIHRADGQIGTGDGNSEVLETEPFTLSVRVQTFLEAGYTWHITFAKGPTKRVVMSQMHHAFTTFQREVEAQAQEASYKIQRYVQQEERTIP